MAILDTHLLCEPSGFDMTEEFSTLEVLASAPSRGLKMDGASV